MTIQSVPSEPPRFEAPAATGLEARSIAQLVAAKLCGLHKVNDYFIRMDATVSDDGCIDLEVTRVYFGGENVTVRMLLQPTAPVHVPPHSLLGPRSSV
ncbi:MAG: hypothetical protein JO063_05080 [Pseudonocardiales bacterium]|nr:hypothetical protein [Pseudonocardiales bacterium]MBV9029017.1 hypothetical protein [Pseudonocardiales bacterium]MBW0009481.1 hypothetical protein [Pseudonocardiales bacterium]